MGRETEAMVTFRGQTALAKVLLESTELILRGGHKARLARAALSNVVGAKDGLTLKADSEPLHVALSAIEASRWAKAILTPPPSLASKLGIGPDKRALVLGEIGDAALAGALAGATNGDDGAASVIVAVIESDSALEAALAKAEATGLPLWCVYPKGQAAQPGDSAIRTRLRGAGMMDSKTSAVSDRFTATKYGWSGTRPGGR